MKKRLLSKQTKELRALGYTGGDRIGDLIEFLGVDNSCDENGDLVIYNCELWYNVCDALLTACKDKLNK